MRHDRREVRLGKISNSGSNPRWKVLSSSAAFTLPVVNRALVRAIHIVNNFFASRQVIRRIGRFSWPPVIRGEYHRKLGNDIGIFSQSLDWNWPTSSHRNARRSGQFLPGIDGWLRVTTPMSSRAVPYRRRTPRTVQHDSMHAGADGGFDHPADGLHLNAPKIRLRSESGSYLRERRRMNAGR
jgi:hypothetical protein